MHLWAETEPCVVTQECDVNTRKHTLTLRVLQQPTDPIFPLLIGDAVHNMRQGLDHLAYQLATRVHGHDPPKNAETTMWPIRDTPTKLSGAIPNDVGSKKRMPPGMYAAIEGFQPYNGRDGLLLGALHTLDNRDKHRFLPVVAGLAEALDLHDVTASGGVAIGGFLFAHEVSGSGTIMLGAIENGRVIVEAGSEVDVDVRPTASIAFDQGSEVAPGELVLSLLAAIHESIVERLFPTMEKFL